MALLILYITADFIMEFIKELELFPQNWKFWWANPQARSDAILNILDFVYGFVDSVSITCVPYHY